MSSIYVETLPYIVKETCVSDARIFFFFYCQENQIQELIAFLGAASCNERNTSV